MDKRKFNGGKRPGAGRKRLYKDPVSITLIVEKDLRERVEEKLGSFEEVKTQLRQHLENIVNE